MSTSNPMKSCAIEFHILQSFPVTCLNRDDVGAPKSAIVGGVSRARVSSQCWKRQVRLALHDLGVRTGIRTKNVARLLDAACAAQGATPDQAKTCANLIAAALTKNTLLFLSEDEIDRLAAYARESGFSLPVEARKKKKGEDAEEGEAGALPKTEITKIRKCLSANNRAADGLDIALFGRMVAQPMVKVNVHAAAAFAHAISTHKADNEVDFFTALDDRPEEAIGAGSAHMDVLEFNSATYYRYVSLDLGQLWDNLGGEDIGKAVEYFTKALYVAVPAARQSTQTGACLWNYARVLVRKGPRMQVAFDKPVSCVSGSGWLIPSIECLNETLTENKRLCGSLYGEQADFTFGKEALGIDELCAGVVEAVARLEQQA